jgi:HTH-type transcriptional regulator / antitoxin MqsA
VVTPFKVRQGESSTGVSAVADRNSPRPHECGGNYEFFTGPVAVTIRGTEITADQTRYRCDRCDEERLTPAQSDTWEESVYAKFEADPRRLLLPREVRALRERLQLSQPQLETALGLGEKTVVRWESGRVVQNRSTDDLLRLIDRDPSALHFLAQLHGVTLPGAATAASGSAGGPGHLRLPDRLGTRLQKLAEQDGVDLGTYVVMVLTQHATGVEMGQQVTELIQARMEGFSEFVREAWPTPRGFAEAAESWRGDLHVAERWGGSASAGRSSYGVVP